MIWWHRAGQKVVCVSVGPVDDAYPNAPMGVLVLDKIYTISAVVRAFNKNREIKIGFKLAEIPDLRWAACPSHFRPVFPQAVEDLRRLTSPTPEQKLAVFEEMVAEQLREVEEA